MNPIITEQLAQEHRQTLLYEAEQERRLPELQHAPTVHRLPRLAAKLDEYLITVGTKLQGAQMLE